MYKIIISLISALIIFSQVSEASSISIQEAKNLFNKYIKLSHNYDGDLINLYADDAIIKRKLVYDDGKTEKIVIPTDKYIGKLKFYRFLAKLRGYKNQYFDLEYEKEGQYVRITGKRNPTTTEKSWPVSYLIGKTKSGKLKILEEYTWTSSTFLVK